MVPMKAGVGGYYTIAAISTDMDGENNDRGHGIQQNIEMQFHGDITLDNGITAGVRLRINGNNGGRDHTHDSDPDENPDRKGAHTADTDYRHLPTTTTTTPSPKAVAATSTTSPRPRCTSRVPSARSTPA